MLNKDIIHINDDCTKQCCNTMYQINIIYYFYNVIKWYDNSEFSRRFRWQRAYKAGNIRSHALFELAIITWTEVQSWYTLFFRKYIFGPEIKGFIKNNLTTLSTYQNIQVKLIFFPMRSEYWWCKIIWIIIWNGTRDWCMWFHTKIYRCDKNREICSKRDINR